jgi:hypothetical protein
VPRGLPDVVSCRLGRIGRASRALKLCALAAAVVCMGGFTSQQMSGTGKPAHSGAGFTGWIGRQITGRDRNFTGWVGAPLNKSHKPVTPIGKIAVHRIVPYWTNDHGCSGYFTGSDPGDMECSATAVDILGDKQVIRRGYWSGGQGFGRNKALYYHNLEMQPIIDTITFSASVNEPKYKEYYYTIYHYTEGNLDQEVQVEVDDNNTSFKGVSTFALFGVRRICGQPGSSGAGWLCGMAVRA